MISKYKSSLIILALIFVLCSNSCTVSEDSGKISKNIAEQNDKAFSEQIKIKPHDYIKTANINRQEKKDYTIMIYMNGSDLESKYQAATIDLTEMADSNFDGENINLLIFTGGAQKWHTKGIPDNLNAIFKMEDGKLTKLAQLDKSAMGTPEVLAGFINFGYNLFPSEKYELIFWNHGGGAVTGYGSDERYVKNPNKAMMKLSEIDSALGSTDISVNEKFDIISFDTCLMSTLEMACIAEKYADYMVASEELEPEGGWDYTFLRDIKPGYSGMKIGKLIIDYYKNFYNNSDMQDIITLSLVDLSKIKMLSESFEKFSEAARNELLKGSYNKISRARNGSYMFGGRTESGGETDMIDVSHLVKSLENLFPDESTAFISSLEKAVIYKYESSPEGLGGLSIYFPFMNKENINDNMKIYKSLNQLPNYVKFIDNFCLILNSKPITNYRLSENTVFETQNDDNYNIALTDEQLENLYSVNSATWKKADRFYIKINEKRNIKMGNNGILKLAFDETCTTLNDYLICAREIIRNEKCARYSIPVKLNGEDADLIAVYNEKYPNGKIIGAASGEDIYNVLDKKITEIRNGDKIAIVYNAEVFNENAEQSNDGKNESLYITDEFIVDDNLILKTEPIGKGEYLYGVSFVDVRQNNHYSNFISKKVS